MPYRDARIIKEREDEKKKKYATLENGFYMDGKILKFQKETLQDTFSIYLPDNIVQMPQEYARIKYPSEFRPSLIFTTMDLNVNIGFTVFPHAMKQEEMKPLTEHIRGVIHREHSDYLLFPSEELQETGICFAFRSHAMDSDLYNMMCMMPIGKKTLQGSFNCPYQEYHKWKKLVRLMWESIREKEWGE